MDFRRQIVTCLFSMLRLSFETQKVKENYAIFLKKGQGIREEKSVALIFVFYSSYQTYPSHYVSLTTGNYYIVLLVSQSNK